MGGDGLGHRFEPTLDPPIERVVVPALITRLVRFANTGIGRNGEGRVATVAIAAAKLRAPFESDHACRRGGER